MTLRKNISEENTKSINSNKETLSNKNKVDINVLLNRVRDSERKEKKTIYILNENNFTDDFEGKRNFLIIEFLYITGVRVSELLSVRVKDFDFKKKIIKVIGKGQKERLLPLPDNFTKKIQLFVQKFNVCNHMFTDKKNKRLYPKKIYRIVKDHLSKYSTKTNNSPHTLRHTFATHMLNNGADINAIKELLGHSSLNATQVYTHNSIEKIKSIYKKAHPRA